jgi:hypothetical protein
LDVGRAGGGGAGRGVVVAQKGALAG